VSDSNKKKSPAHLIGKLLFCMSAFIEAVSAVFADICIQVGEPVPNPKIGLTYPVKMHGMLYVPPFDGIMYQQCFLGGFIVAALGVCIFATAGLNSEEDH